MFFRDVKPSTRFCWHYETGQFRVLQRPSAAFSPVLTHQLSKSHLVAARLAAKVDLTVPPRRWRLTGTVFRLEALHTGPGFDHGAIHRESSSDSSGLTCGSTRIA